MKDTACPLYPPFPNGPHYACRHIPLQAKSNKNSLERNSESGWMLSSGEDKPGSEALLSEPGLGCLVLVWLPLVGHVGTHLGQSQSQIQSSLTRKSAFIHNGQRNNGLQYKLNPREREETN